MWGWWRRRKAYRELVDREAAELIERYGDAAYHTARACGRGQEGRLARYWSKVALAVARRTGREVGVDTATRYLDESLH